MVNVGSRIVREKRKYNTHMDFVEDKVRKLSKAKVAYNKISEQRVTQEDVREWKNIGIRYAKPYAKRKIKRIIFKKVLK